MPIYYKRLEEYALQLDYFGSESRVATIEKMKELGVTEGDFVYVLGFPMGLVGEVRNSVIVRSGCIARMRDVLNGTGHEFLLYVPIFPGNSGGPVILKPESISVKGTPGQSAAYLIGIIKSFMRYQYTIDENNKTTQVRTDWNSGLASAIPVDYIMETIQEALRSPLPEPSAEGPL